MSRICAELTSASRLVKFVVTCVAAALGAGCGGGPPPPDPCAVVVDVAPNSTTAGSLATGDCSMGTLFPGSNDASLVDGYRVTLASAGTLTVALDSLAFDALLLMGTSLQQPPIAFDDDSGGNGNARFSVPIGAGTYFILANSAFSTADMGPYTLTLTFVPDVWQPTSAAGAAEARTEHTAVWTGMEMIVWGGQDGNSIAKNTGARFNPATNTWSAIATTSAPSARWGHTAVWTGTEMIVWGGFSGSPNFQTLNDGARYNPQTDVWTPLPAANQPSVRVYHSAMWTGAEMIVWGGFSCLACANAELATGARYRVASDDWVGTANNANATARANHTAIWTGSRMIVWGGENDAGLLGTGAAYDPVADDWVATTANNAPVPTRCHSAVWTGSEMILFGGQINRNLGCGISSTGTAARYSPASDTWSRLITWFDSAGARYDPATNTWNGMSTNDDPEARRRHTLVWTGSRVVVWGGDFAGPLASGGIYDPSVDMTP